MHSPFDWNLTASTPWLALLLAGALKATVLLSFAWVATRFLRRAPAATRHLIWTLALVAAIGVPLVSLVVPAWPLGWVPSMMGGGNVAPPPALMLVDTQDPKPADPLTPQTAATRASANTPSNVASRIEDEPVTRAEDTPIVQAAETPATSPTPPAGFAWPRIDPRMILRLTPMVWLLGAILLLGRRALAAMRIGRLARRAAPVTDWEWRGALQRHAASLGITPAPALLISDEADVPMTFGTLRPVIVVPATAVEWTPARRDVVLLHELGHIRRRDTLAMLIGQLAAALYWFHPLVWLAKRGQRVEAEHACDDQVLRSGALASAYARELLELATAARPHDTYGAAALAMARRSQLEGRLLTILDPRSARGGVGRRFAALAVLLTVAATAALAAARPARETSTEPAAIAAVAAESHSTGSIATANTPADPAPTSDTPADIVAEPYGPDLALAPVTSDDAPVVASTSTSVSTSAGGGDPALTGSAESGSAIAVLADPPVTARAAASSKDDHRNSSWSIHDDDGVLKSVNGTWEDDGFEGTFKSKGEIRFNDALDDVESLSSGGSLTVEEVRPNGDRRRAEFRLKDGEIQRTWWVGSTRREWGPEARQWFKGFLIETDHRSGMLATQRFPRLMKEGGPRRVMDEISLMTSDYGKSIYFRKLIESGLGKEDLRRAVTQAGNEVKSDYELARILATTAEKGALTDQATRTAFVTAVDGIESDYEHARVLMMVLEQPKLDPALANDALRSASRVGSDYERARLLVKMAEKGNVTPESQREYLRAARGIKSDYEKSRALQALVENERVANANVAVLLSAVASISSDYECSSVLVKIAGSLKLDAAGKQAYVETAKAIGSTYERNRALAALGESADFMDSPGGIYR